MKTKIISQVETEEPEGKDLPLNCRPPSHCGAIPARACSPLPLLAPAKAGACFSPCRRLPSGNVTGAFTLIELLVVIAVIALLAALLLPALSRAKAKGQAVTCLSNYWQLQLAWQMYADDHRGIMPVNRITGVNPFRSVPGSWVVGNARMDVSPTNLTGGVLYPYHQAVGIYHCPTDQATFIQQPQLRRWRSCMLNFYLNGSLQVGSANWTRIKVNTAALLRPAGIFTFIDTSEWTINDGAFVARWLGMVEGDQTWNDYPTDRHNQGATICFADGHAERWKWRCRKSAQTLFTPVADALDLEDLRRLQAALPDP